MTNWQESLPDDLTPTWTTSVKDYREDVARMAQFTVPEGGPSPRPPAVDWDADYGATFSKPKRNPKSLG
jgi:hypothetical protein